LCKERIVGVDFSRGMLDEAARRSRRWPGSARVELVQDDVFSMPYREEFDVVTCAGAFGHIEERDEMRFLAKIHDALVPNGRFVFPTSVRPAPSSAWFWIAHGFNAAMRVRNAILRPEFVMYYLTFLW